MILGYNTNGFAHHRLEDAIEIIAELGYEGIAVTPDVNHLDPYSSEIESESNEINLAILNSGLNVVIETGARFILNSRVKHQPTLISPQPTDQSQRYDFLLHCISMAHELGSDVVSFWSGKASSEESPSQLMTRLVEQCQRLADDAAKMDVRLAFEPEPGMFIDTMDKFAELHSRVDHPHFGLTLDVGHLICLNELPVSKAIYDWQHFLWNIHLDDMKPNVHDHLMFGEGSVNFQDLFTALKSIDYQGMASVELSRHSFDAVNAATQSMQFLKPFVS